MGAFVGEGLVGVNAGKGVGAFLGEGVGAFLGEGVRTVVHFDFFILLNGDGAACTTSKQRSNMKTKYRMFGVGRKYRTKFLYISVFEALICSDQNSVPFRYQKTDLNKFEQDKFQGKL